MTASPAQLSTWILLAVGLPAATAGAAITEFRGVETQAAWESEVGSWQTMDFTGFGAGHHLTDEYEASLGVVFTDTTHQVDGPSEQTFPQDGWGLVSGTFATFIEFELATPVMALGVLFPGGVNLTFWLGDELVGDATHAQAGVGNFLGVISDVPFDRVVIDDEADIAFVDDIRFGLAVPGPGGLMLLTTVVGIGCGRRRR